MTKRYSTHLATFALCLAAMQGTAALAQNSDDGSVVYLDQGWTEDQRQYYYHQTQGTAMLPLAFYRNIERAGSEMLFSDPENLRRLGMVPADKDEKYNPEGLPIGLALNVVEEGIYKGEWVGFTCSSCHNGELFYQGKTIRVDGGSNHIFSMPHFARELREATHATMADDAKLDRLLNRAGGETGLSKEEMKSELETISKYLDYFVDRVAGSAHDFGPGRMDALNQIHNTISGVYLNVPENVEMTDAPTKSPFVWNSPQSAWVQWSGILARPLTRNLGESLGAMTRVNIDPNKGEMFESTVDFRGQFEIEQSIWDLEPPRWPEAVFGEIDKDLAMKGKELVEANCVSCHTTYPYRWSPPREMGKRFVENALVPHAYVGTDGMQFRSGQVDPLPSYFSGLVKDLLPAPYTGKAATNDGAIQDALKNGVIEKYVPKLGLTDEELLSWNNYLPEDVPGPSVPSYKAAPLEGMWAAPPYLHNNSVASIYELLMPASERPKTWKQGRDYDPKKVGLDTSGTSGEFVVDTSLVGMSNAGHSFEDGPLGNGVVGRAFSEEERWAIVEYMKMLPDAPGQNAPYGGPENPVDAWKSDTYFNNVHPSGYYNGDGEAPKGDISGGGASSAGGAESGYQKKSGILPSPEDQEIKTENEDALIESIKEVVLQRMKDTYPDGKTMKRDAHPKSHGVAHGKLIVEPGLPAEFRKGIFANQAEYTALIRFSASLQQVTPDIVQQPQGLAIKLLGVEGEKVLDEGKNEQTQDFVMINHPVFFVSDLESYLSLFQAQVGKPEELEAWARKYPENVAVVGRMIAEEFYNPAAVQYWSQTPYKFGDRVAKYSVRPLSGAKNERPESMLLDYQREELVKTLKNGEVRFEFLIQFQKDPEAQPVEDPRVVWQEADTQPIRVATLVLPQQDISGDKNLEIAENLSFTVWHTLEDHRPLGAVNRARRAVYMAGSKLRHAKNGVERKEPTEIPNW